eukprot:SM000302S11671  [mRNA]  locus=s302:6271:9337:- [translate_table: standard]
MASRKSSPSEGNVPPIRSTYVPWERPWSLRGQAAQRRREPQSHRGPVATLFPSFQSQADTPAAGLAALAAAGATHCCIRLSAGVQPHGQPLHLRLGGRLVSSWQLQPAPSRNACTAVTARRQDFTRAAGAGLPTHGRRHAVACVKHWLRRGDHTGPPLVTDFDVTAATGPITATAPVSEATVKRAARRSSPLLEGLRKKLHVTPSMLLCLGHAASLFGVVALFMKDMLFLRSFMICGSLCGVAFNLLQPSPLSIPALWGCVFITLNLTQIGILLHERRPVTFQKDEAEVYEAIFQSHGVTPHQFEKLMHSSGAEWSDLPAAHIILKEGEEVEKISIFVSGGADVMKDEEKVGVLDRGSLVGETALLVKGHKAGHTVITNEPSRIISWPKYKLREVLAVDQNLLLSTAKVINSDLAKKLAHSGSSGSSQQGQILKTYQEVLLGICADGLITPSEKRALREYRSRHHITQTQHLEAIADCGWTAIEFEDGAKLDRGKQFSLKGSMARLLGTHKKPSASSTPSPQITNCLEEISKKEAQEVKDKEKSIMETWHAAQEIDPTPPPNQAAVAP